MGVLTTEEEKRLFTLLNNTRLIVFNDIGDKEAVLKKAMHQANEFINECETIIAKDGFNAKQG